MEKLAFVEKIDLENNPEDNVILTKFQEGTAKARRQSQLVMGFAAQKELEMKLLANDANAVNNTSSDDDDSKNTSEEDI